MQQVPLLILVSLCTRARISWVHHDGAAPAITRTGQIRGLPDIDVCGRPEGSCFCLGHNRRWVLCL